MYTVGQYFPEVNLKAVDEENEIVDVQILSGWTVVYFYPKDFTFICPTEIAAMDCLLEEADDVIGVSGDNEYCKLAWKEQNPVIKDIKHILAADCGLTLSKELGIVNEEEGVCNRATFILDPDGIIMHVSVNHLDTGRNAREILRTLQALKAGGLTGCEWNPGEDFVA